MFAVLAILGTLVDEVGKFMERNGRNEKDAKTSKPKPSKCVLFLFKINFVHPNFVQCLIRYYLYGKINSIKAMTKIFLKYIYDPCFRKLVNTNATLFFVHS